jgi:hypothetical protein
MKIYVLFFDHQNGLKKQIHFLFLSLQNIEFLNFITNSKILLDIFLILLRLNINFKKKNIFFIKI